jgi:glycosyltransferase involved in cell wall biosynthesis
MPPIEQAGSLQIVYSGNLGLAHDVGTMIAAMRDLRNDARFRFTFIGGGARRAELSAFTESESIPFVELLPYVPRADLGSSLGMGNIGLVTQREDCCGSVVPSKVYGLLAAGRPILFIGPAAATPARIIQKHKCGWHVSIGEADAVVQLLRHLADHPEEVIEAGSNARTALEQNFDRPLGTARIIHQLVGDVPGVLPSSLSSSYADRTAQKTSAGYGA